MGGGNGQKSAKAAEKNRLKAEATKSPEERKAASQKQAADAVAIQWCDRQAQHHRRRHRHHRPRSSSSTTFANRRSSTFFIPSLPGRAVLLAVPSASRAS